MKSTTRIILFLLFIFALAIPGGSVLASEPAQGSLAPLPDEFVFGENYILNEGEVLNGNLWVFGGNADLRSESRVNGDILIAGGNLSVNGEVTGNITATGGNVSLMNGAIVRGDVNMIGSSLQRSNQARVDGDINEQARGPFQFALPRTNLRIPRLDISMNPVWEFMTFLFQSFLVSALAVLVGMFWPRQTTRVARTAVTQPLVSGGLGLLTVIVVPIVMLVLAITLILIPVSLLVGLVLGIVLLFGWIAIGMEVGQRMASLFKTEWALPVAAGLGTLVLSIIVGGVGKYVWCIGWLAPVLVLLVGLGSVLLTRFGTQDYPPYAGLPPAQPTGPAPYVPVTPQWEPEEPRFTRGEGTTDVDEDQTPSSGASVYPSQDEPPAGSS